MMHAAPWWIAGVDGGLERSNSEARINRAADGVTYDPTGLIIPASFKPST